MKYTRNIVWIPHIALSAEDNTYNNQNIFMKEN